MFQSEAVLTKAYKKIQSSHDNGDRLHRVDINIELDREGKNRMEITSMRDIKAQNLSSGYTIQNAEFKRPNLATAYNPYMNTAIVTLEL